MGEASKSLRWVSQLGSLTADKAGLTAHKDLCPGLPLLHTTPKLVQRRKYVFRHITLQLSKGHSGIQITWKPQLSPKFVRHSCFHSRPFWWMGGLSAFSPHFQQISSSHYLVPCSSHVPGCRWASLTTWLQVRMTPLSWSTITPDPQVGPTCSRTTSGLLATPVHRQYNHDRNR